MEVTRQFLVYKGVIPASCYKIGGQVRINLTKVYGIEYVDATIAAIVAGSTAGTDLISFTFDDTTLPFPGSELDTCNLLSFSCQSCGCSQWCEEIFGPGEELAETTRHAGYVDRPIHASYVFVSVPEPQDHPVEFQILIDGANLFASPAQIVGDVARVHKASYASAFADGMIPADARVDVVVSKTGSELLEEDEPGYMAGYGYKNPPARGLRLCFGGDIR